MSNFQALKKNFPITKQAKNELKKITLVVIKKSKDPYFLEKRRRMQVYTAMDHYLSGISWYDFFTKDALKILTNGKIVAYLLDEKKVTSDMLLYSFFSPKLDFNKILKKGNITKATVGSKLWQKRGDHDTIELSLLIRNFFYKFLRCFPFSRYLNPRYTEIENIQDSIEYSKEVHLLIKKAVRLARKRFKTPLISPEILFITLLETKACYAGKMLEEIVPDRIKWLKVRYAMLKRLHKIEDSIRYTIPTNLVYFDYLFRSRIPGTYFLSLVPDPLFHYYAVLRYRTKVVESILKTDFLKILKQHHLSLMLTRKKRETDDLPKDIFADLE